MQRHSGRFFGGLLLLSGAAAVCGSLRCSFLLPQASSRRDAGMPLARGLRGSPLKERGPPPMRLGPGGGADPVNNVSPEMAAAGRKYAQRYEDIFRAGRNLWLNMKKQGKDVKIYFIGPPGNSGDRISNALMEALAYIPAPDGTYYIRRKAGVEYPKIKYNMLVTDKRIAEKAPISPIDLYMEDEEKYRDLETEALKEFEEADTQGFPAGCIVGEGAVLRQENIDILKKGLVIWLDLDPEFSWAKTQYSPKQGSGIMVPKDDATRPPVWAIANGWDGDVDDAEGKLEYVKILQDRNSLYEKIADIRLRVDIPGIAENSYWGAERLVKAITQHFGFSNEAVSLDEEIFESDLQKFLESARLSKYLKPVMEWCDKQGAATIEDIVENVPDLAEALELKPLERKRLEKAAASVAAG